MSNSEWKEIKKPLQCHLITIDLKKNFPLFCTNPTRI